MKRTNARTMDFFDRHVGELIMKHYGMSELEAVRQFISSEIYGFLLDEELRVWHFSPVAIFDMWENEYKTGDFRNSLYIRGAEL